MYDHFLQSNQYIYINYLFIEYLNNLIVFFLIFEI